MALATLMLVLCACNRRPTDDLQVPVQRIDFNSLQRARLSDVFTGATDYILLKDDGEEALFGRIDKLKMKNGNIYIADERKRVLLVYDYAGNYVGQVGVHGQGPKEYVNLGDYAVSDEGDIYLLDGNVNKVLHFNADFECVDECMLPFEADVFTSLPDDSLLFGLSSWNTDEGAGYKVALTDRQAHMAATCLPYDEYTDPSYWISGYRFADDGSRLAYNQTISNYIYLFTPQGQLQEAFFLDFGNENVPDKDKIDVESKLDNYDDYTMIRKILGVTDKYIVGFLWQHRQKKLFVLDYPAGRCYLGETIDDLDRTVGCGFVGAGEGLTGVPAIVSYIEEADEKRQLPDSVVRFVNEEGIALQIQYLQ